MRRQILGLGSDLRFLLYQKPISMAGGIEKLKGVIINELKCEPTNGDVYIFISKSHKVIKLLHYHHYVFSLYVRKITKGSFVYPKYNPQTDKYEIDWLRLRKLVRGYPND